ncbi:MAG: hypothetical protein J6A59_11070 [Lachnospiraceae bacterium]|nr:hypothetical protein [Lachnospiraceae bacterium]
MFIGSFEDFERKQEEEFRAKCEEFAYYQGNRQRVTIDREWTEEDLKDEVKDEVFKIVQEWNSKHIGRAVYNTDMLLDAYVAETIINGIDLIETYNREYDKHKNEKRFGIHYFDEWLKKELVKQLNKNLVLK